MRGELTEQNLSGAWRLGPRTGRATTCEECAGSPLERERLRLRVVGLDAEVLVAEYGPDQLIPVPTKADGSTLTDDDEKPEPVPFVRAEQEMARHYVFGDNLLTQTCQSGLTELAIYSAEAQALRI